MSVLVLIFFIFAKDDFSGTIFKVRKNGTEIKYTLAAGDTLEKIANRFNTSVINIIVANELENMNQFPESRTILIPGTIKKQRVNQYFYNYEKKLDDEMIKLKKKEQELKEIEAKINVLRNEMDNDKNIGLEELNRKSRVRSSLKRKYKSECQKYSDMFTEFSKLMKCYNRIAELADTD